MIASFNAKLERDATSGWIHVRWAESKAVLLTGKPVKVNARVDGFEFETTLMPLGDGAHMVPIKASVRKKIKKEEGDVVRVVIVSRRT